MKNRLILPALVVMATGAALLGGTFVNAQTATADTSQPTSIIQRLVNRFGLKEADVKAVFAEEHVARQADMKAQEETRLAQLVTDGKITEAQKQLIIAKRAEMQANRPTEDPSLTPAAMRAQMEAHRAELDAWAKTNGIDAKYLIGGFGGKGHGGPGMGERMPMMKGDWAPTASASTN